jgi:hypothetical protein
MGAVAAEIRKLTSVRATWILTLLGWAFVGLGVATTLFGGFGGPFTGDAGQVADAVGAAGSNSAIVLVVGLLLMTTEFRHDTIGRTLQLTPSRTRVLAAKLAVGALYAVVFVIGALVVVAALVAIAGATEGVDLRIDGGSVEVAWQALVGMVLTSLLGVAFGALVRAQVVAVTVALIWVFAIENVVAGLLPDVGRWLPFQAVNGLFLSEAAIASAPDGTFIVLEPIQALGVFLAWVAVFLVAAGLLLRYRDV